VVAAPFGRESVEHSLDCKSPRYFFSPFSFSSEFLQLFNSVVFSFANPAFLESEERIERLAANKLAYSPYSLLLALTHAPKGMQISLMVERALLEKLVLTDDQSIGMRVEKPLQGFETG
jgi:hypothetical protein